MSRTVGPVTVAGQTIYTLGNPGNTPMDSLLGNFQTICSLFTTLGATGATGATGAGCARKRRLHRRYGTCRTARLHRRDRIARRSG